MHRCCAHHERSAVPDSDGDKRVTINREARTGQEHAAGLHHAAVFDNRGGDRGVLLDTGCEQHAGDVWEDF